MMKQDCTCAHDYVRQDGTCIHKDECPCYDEHGNEYPTNGTFTKPGEGCKKFECVNGEIIDHYENCGFCGPGFVRSNSTKDPNNPCCGKCEPTTKPGKKCEMEQVSEKLVVKHPSGFICRTPQDVTLGICKGSCDNEGSIQRGAIMLNGVEMKPASTNCSCCSGVGNTINVNFDCEGAGPMAFDVMSMTSCSCDVCGGSAADDNTGFVTQAQNAVGAPNGNLNNIPNLGSYSQNSTCTHRLSFNALIAYCRHPIPLS